MCENAKTIQCADHFIRTRQHKLSEMAIKSFVGESPVYELQFDRLILQNIDIKIHDADVLTLKGIGGYAVECSTRKILDGDMLRTCLTALRRLLMYIPINFANIRRTVADKLGEAYRYCL